MIDWIQVHYLEIFGVVSGLLFLYFEYKENAWLWPVGLVSSAIYVAVFYSAKFYADMGLQVYYVVISIYGWLAWLRGKHNEQPLKIRRAGKPLFIKVTTVSVALWLALYFVLKAFTDSPVPLGDAFTSAFAITATWMLSRKILEQWSFWIVINFVSMALYFYRDLYLTAFLYAVYGIISIAGYYEWKKKMNVQMD